MIVRVQCNRRAPGRFRRWAPAVLMAGGAGLLAYCGWFYLQTALFQAREEERFDDLRGYALPKPAPPAGSAQPIPRAAPEEGAVIGRMEIPRIGISVMVVEGVTQRSLKLAAGHVPGTALPDASGNVGIAAHRDTFFRKLRKIRKDDAIWFTTLDGVFKYSVESTRVVRPQDISVLRSSTDPVLTLVTCYPFYYVGPAPQRFIVRAQQIARPACTPALAPGLHYEGARTSGCSN